MVVLIPNDIDPTGEAQRFAGQASQALMRGDTRQAREFRDKAGRVYEADVHNRRKRSDKDALRYLAATQYYHGGLYEKALKLCRKIQADMLPNRFRDSYAVFLKAVHERAKPDYAQKLRERITRLWRQHEFQEIIDVLKEHSFVIEDESRLATVRGQCLERLGNYKVAALFFGDAVQKASDNPQVLFFSTVGPFHLLAKKQFDEAWSYAQELQAMIPHQLITLVSSVVRFHQAVHSLDKTEKHQLHEDQVRIFEEAEKSLIKLAPDYKSRADCREIKIFALLSAVVAYCSIGKLPRAMEVFSQAVALAPDDRLVQALQTIPDFPKQNTEVATQKVIEFGGQFTRKQEEQEMPLSPLAA